MPRSVFAELNESRREEGLELYVISSVTGQGIDPVVYALADGPVHGFTLDPTIGEFLLSHENIQTPTRGKIYSANEVYWDRWQPGVRSFIENMRDPKRKMTARYIGSLVSDFHRNLLKGGVFLYPATAASPQGKLRVLYEARLQRRVLPHHWSRAPRRRSHH